MITYFAIGAVAAILTMPERFDRVEAALFYLFFWPLAVVVAVVTLLKN